MAHNISKKKRTKDIIIEENVSFESMYLSDNVLAGLNKCGFKRPSPIQLSAIPLGRCGLDLIVQAKSGTGKTLVFAVIALEMISVFSKATQVLIVAPTREIAFQITNVINSLSSDIKEAKIYSFIGGLSVQEDLAKLKCCHIAVGTPGRLKQLCSMGNLDLQNTRLLVLDEADQLLTGQFKSDILELVQKLPKNKQILTMSATYPDEIAEFLNSYMRSPTEVRLDKESPALLGVYHCVKILPDSPQVHKRHEMKLKELKNLLSSVQFNQCLVFSNSQLRAESISKQLEACKWPATFLTGAQVQTERLKSFSDLCTYKCRILVSTDLSARGLDSAYVNLVINLDVPHNQATYLHRVGRAGRFGSKGIAINLVCDGSELNSLKKVAISTNISIKVIKKNYFKTMKEYENLPLLDCSIDEDSISPNSENRINIRKPKTCDSKKIENGEINNVLSYQNGESNETHDSEILEQSGKNANFIQEIDAEAKQLLTDAHSKESKNNQDCFLNTEIHQCGDISAEILKSVKLSALDVLPKSKKFNDIKFSFSDLLSETKNKKIVSELDVNICSNSYLEDFPPDENLRKFEKYLDMQRSTFSDQKFDEKTDYARKLNEIIHGIHSVNISEESVTVLSNTDSESRQGILQENIVPQLKEDAEEKNEISVLKIDVDYHKTNENKQKSCNDFTASKSTSLEEKKLNDISEKKSSTQTEIEKNLKQQQYSSATGYGQWTSVNENEKLDKCFRDEANYYETKESEKECSRSWLSYDDYKHIKEKKNFRKQKYNTHKEKVYISKKASRNVKHRKKVRPKSKIHVSSSSSSSSDCTSKSSDSIVSNLNDNDSYYRDYYHSTNAYIESAKKFAQMMEYVTSVGKMSSYISRNRNKFLNKT